MKLGFSKVGKNLLIGAKGVRSKSSLDLKKYQNKYDIQDYELKTVAELVQQKIKENIENEKSYKGGKLKAIKKETALRKGSTAILYDTGQLQNSIEVEKSGKAYIVKVSDAIYRYRNKSGRTGKRLKTSRKKIRISEIASFHQYGGGTLPKRAFFGITNKDLKTIINTVFKKRRNLTKAFMD